VPTEVGLLLVHGSNFGQMPFLPPPATRGYQQNLGIAGCKSVTLTTDHRRPVNSLLTMQNLVILLCCVGIRKVPKIRGY